MPAQPERRCVRSWSKVSSNSADSALRPESADSTRPFEPYSPSNRFTEPALAEEITAANKGAPFMENFGFASTGNMHAGPIEMPTDRSVRVRFLGRAAEPLVVPSEPIDYDFTVTIDASDPLHPKYEVVGKQDGFPGYEVLGLALGGPATDPGFQLMYKFVPPQSRTPLSLAPVFNDEELPPGEFVGEIP